MVDDCGSRNAKGWQMKSLNLIARLRIHGVPQQKGSKRAFRHKHTDRIVVVEDNKRSKPWQQMIAGSAAKHSPDYLSEGPILLNVTFVMPRPKKIPKNRYGYPSTKPDVDKLLRVVCDALTGVLYRDDSQIIVCTMSKVYATENSPPGAIISVSEYKSDDGVIQ